MAICANCGAQLKDDQLLCEVCGAEVSLVPEFEPLIEERINQTLSRIVTEDEFIEYTADNADEFETYEGEETFEEYVDEPLADDGLYEEFEPYEEVSEPKVEDAEKELVNAFHLNTKKKSPRFDAKAALTKNNSVSKPVITTQNKPVVERDDLELLEEDITEYEETEFIDIAEDDEALKEAVKASITVKKPVSDKAPKKKEKPARSKKADKPSFFHSILSKKKESDEDEFDPDDDFGDFDDDIHIFRFIFEFIRDSKFRWVAIALLAVFILLVVLLVRKVTGSVYENSSATHQAELARAEAANGNYKGAIEYMAKAINLSPEDDGLRFEQANYYFALDDNESALIELKIIVGKKGAGYTTAYQMLVDYYSERSDYESINTLLSTCTDEMILSMYADYVANEPMFSQAEGTYEDTIVVEIVPPGNGLVYYTTDGSDPTTDSDIYYSPIMLDLGIYHIKAMYVNPYGIQSPTVTKTYTVDIRTPDAPEVLTAGGTYSYPRLIEVDVQKGCDLYYTTDNTLPTRMSNKYEGPIPMPVGSSHFLFVAYTAEGISGDVTEVSYNLQISSKLDLNQVVVNLCVYDYLAGRAFDVAGNLPGNTTHYDYKFEWACTNGVTFPAWDDLESPMPTVKNDQIFYVVVERLIDSMGNDSKTGVIYLVNAERGDIYVAGKNAETNGFLDDNGKLIFGTLIPPESYTLPPELTGNGD